MSCQAPGPEHSFLCVCEACAPANRGALERLVSQLDGWVDGLGAVAGLGLAAASLAACSSTAGPTSYAEVGCLGDLCHVDASFDAADSSEAGDADAEGGRDE